MLRKTRAKRNSDISTGVPDSGGESSFVLIVMQGFMMKKKRAKNVGAAYVLLRRSFGQKWVKRWVVLQRDGRLVYYRERPTTSTTANWTPDGVICDDIDACRIDRARDGADTMDKASYIGNSFFISVPSPVRGGGGNRSTLLVTKGKEDHAQWVRAFRKTKAGMGDSLRDLSRYFSVACNSYTDILTSNSPPRLDTRASREMDTRREAGESEEAREAEEERLVARAAQLLGGQEQMHQQLTMAEERAKEMRLEKTLAAVGHLEHFIFEQLEGERTAAEQRRHEAEEDARSEEAARAAEHGRVVAEHEAEIRRLRERLARRSVEHESLPSDRQREAADEQAATHDEREEHREPLSPAGETTANNNVPGGHDHDQEVCNSAPVLVQGGHDMEATSIDWENNDCEEAKVESEPTVGSGSPVAENQKNDDIERDKGRSLCCSAQDNSNQGAVRETPAGHATESVVAASDGTQGCTDNGGEGAPSGRVEGRNGSEEAKHESEPQCRDEAPVDKTGEREVAGDI